VKTDIVTRSGIPVYKIEVPKSLLRGKFGSRRVAEPRGQLAEYLKKKVELPACILVHHGKKLSRLVKINEDGTLYPVDNTAITKAERKRLQQ
jgi:hypothetical protein